MPTNYTEKNYQPLPNKEAIVHFNGKTLLTAESYLDVKAYEHALAFTVAGLMDEDLLKDVRDAVASALEHGEDFRTFKQRLKPYLMSKGWLSEVLDDGTKQLVAGSNRRLKTIFSTNLQSAYSAGQWSRIQQTKEFLPYLQYMPSVSENPRLSHKRYYGLCRPVDDVIWQSIMPSNGWGCKCWVKQLTKRQANNVLDEQQKAVDAGRATPFEWETEEYTNPKTGEVTQVPKGIDPSFAHNHDRLTALLRLAEDKHGTDFSKRLAEKAQSIMMNVIKVDENLVSMRTDWENFPNIYIAHSANTITSHEKYVTAKAGDMASAQELVNDYLKDDFLEDLATFIKKFDDIYVLPVHAEEMAGRNKIPVAYATALQQILDLNLDTDIVQATRAYRTQADGIGRLVRRVNFEGDVVKDRNYLIVDDVVTQGGTLADLRGYIESKGGNVVAASTLSGKANSAKIAVTKSTLGQLRKLAGKELEQWWQEQFGYDFAKLTESEARYINKQIHRDGINAVRDKLIAARLETSR